MRQIILLVLGYYDNQFAWYFWVWEIWVYLRLDGLRIRFTEPSKAIEMGWDYELKMLRTEVLKSLPKFGSEYIKGIDPFVVDALRGTLWETKYRGTLTQYIDEYPNVYGYTLAKIVERTIQRLETNPDKVDIPVLQTLDSFVGLGTYRWKYDEQLIHAAIRFGINFFDTAETYGYGQVEQALGKALAAVVPHKPIRVATKVSRNHMSYGATRNAVLRSLDKLKLDKIFLYQIYWPNPKQPIEHTLRAIAELWGQGLVEHIGVSNFSIDQLSTARYYLRQYDGLDVYSNQIRWNLLDRGAECALMMYCQSNGIRVIVYSPFSQNFQAVLKTDVLELLSKLARNYNCTEAQIVLAWMLRRKGVIIIPATNNPQHVKEIAEASLVKLTTDDARLVNFAYPITELV